MACLAHVSDAPFLFVTRAVSPVTVKSPYCQMDIDIQLEPMRFENGIHLWFLKPTLNAVLTAAKLHNISQHDHVYHATHVIVSSMLDSVCFQPWHGWLTSSLESFCIGVGVNRSANMQPDWNFHWSDLSSAPQQQSQNSTPIKMSQTNQTSAGEGVGPTVLPLSGWVG
eukprot:3639854-Amphidinium_carterae.1